MSDLKTIGGGVMQYAGRGLGAKSLEQYGQEVGQNAAAESAPYRMQVEDVGKAFDQGIGPGLGAVADLVTYTAGNQLPMLATAVLGGGVGRLAAIPFMAKAAEGATAVEKALALRKAAKVADVGSELGVFGSSTAMELGQIAPEGLKPENDASMMQMALGALLSGATDTVAPVYLARKLGLIGAAEHALLPRKAGFGAIAKDAGTTALKVGGFEAGQETLQSYIERLSANQPTTGAEANSDYLNSAVMGGIMGGLSGGVAGGVHAMRSPIQEAPVVPPTEPVAPAAEPAAVSPVDAALAHQAELTTAHQAATEQVTTLEAQVRDTQTQRDATTAKLAELTAETKLPFDQRRAKSVILAERKTVQAQAKELKAAADPLEEQYHAARQAVETLTPQLEQAAQSASYQQTLATTPAELNPDIQFKEAPPASDIIETTPPVSDTTAAETAVAKVKRGLGMLVSSREAKLAPVADVRTQALEVVGKRARETTKTVGEQTRQGAVETAAVQAAQPSIKELVAAKNLKPGGQEKLTVVLTNALNDIAKTAAALPTTEEAQAHIQAEVPKVLKGRVAAQDAQEVASIMSDAVGQSHTLYSKGATESDSWQLTREQYFNDPMRVKRDVLGDQPASHIVKYEYLDPSGAGPFKGSMASKTPMKSGAVVAAPFGAARVVSSARAKPADVSVNSLYDEAKAFHARVVADAVAVGKPVPAEVLADYPAAQESHAALTQTEFEKFPQVAQEAAIDAYNEVMTSVGTRLRSRLTSLIGDDPSLVVQTFTAKQGEAIGAYTRVDKYKSVISMALNAKDGLSIADHEGFHYIEDKILTSAERRIIANALKEGRPVYERLMERVRQYDRENARENRTNLADEVSGTPAEARAYAFEFWRRGELQVEGALNRVFEKLRQFFEKVANLVKGLGFTSMEDIFNSLDRSQFAERKRGSRGLSETERLPLRTIMYSKVRDGVYSLRAEAADGRMVVGEGALSAASVEMVVGESTFRKIEAGAGVKLEGGWNQLTGSNLTARPGEGVTLYSAEETAAWYRSMLTEQVTALPTKAASAQGWKDQIKGLVAKGLVRQTEIDAVGLNEFLDLQQGKVSKDAVTAFLRENGVQVQDVMLEADPRTGLSATQFRNLTDEQKQQLPGYDYADDMTFVVMRGDQPLHLSDQGYGGKPSVAIDQYISILNENLDAPAGAPKFNRPDLLLPGGTNYKELLLTLPTQNRGATNSEINQLQARIEQKGLNGITAGERDLLRRGGNEAFDMLDDWQARLGVKTDDVAEVMAGGNKAAQFKSSHFDQPNILAHIRFNERRDSEGKKVLFLEEIQSDFGQSFKKAKDAIGKAVDSDFQGIIERMKKAGVLEVNCD
ncbi:MAG: hypothetical protein NUW01_13235 [Gemmatimonadaceae bacterium]|nr:hypothetical protein [Gemmatimonadaceae bacterium]